MVMTVRRIQLPTLFHAPLFHAPLFLLVPSANTIVAGGHVLRKCCNYSDGAGLRLILMPLVRVPLRRPDDECHREDHGKTHFVA